MAVRQDLRRVRGWRFGLPLPVFHDFVHFLVDGLRRDIDRHLLFLVETCKLVFLSEFVDEVPFFHLVFELLELVFLFFVIFVSLLFFILLADLLLQPEFSSLHRVIGQPRSQVLLLLILVAFAGGFFVLNIIAVAFLRIAFVTLARFIVLLVLFALLFFLLFIFTRVYWILKVKKKKKKVSRRCGSARSISPFEVGQVLLLQKCPPALVRTPQKQREPKL